MGGYFSELVQKGGAMFWGLVLIVGLLSIFLGDLHARRRGGVAREAKLFAASPNRHLRLRTVNLICLVTLFLFDWLYPIAFRWFGKKRFVYPTLMTVLGALGGALRGAATQGGDAAEFMAYGLLPGFVTIHCLGWVHVNVVYARIRQHQRR